MRFVRTILILLFIISGISFTLILIKQRMDEDFTVPVITSDREVLQISVADLEEEIFAGLTATDPKDGDLTSAILVEGISKFINEGTVNVSYAVFDSDFNVGRLTRRLEFTDYVSPRFSLTQPMDFYVNDMITTVGILTAKDAIAGDITNKIRVLTSNVDNREAGVYSALVQVTNDYGDTSQLELPVFVSQRSFRSVTISLSSYLIYIKAGDTFNANDYLVSVTGQGDGLISNDDVRILSNVKTDTAGVYYVTYSVQGQDGSEAGICHMIVVVEDTEENE